MPFSCGERGERNLKSLRQLTWLAEIDGLSEVALFVHAALIKLVSLGRSKSVNQYSNRCSTWTASDLMKMTYRDTLLALLLS